MLGSLSNLNQDGFATVPNIYSDKEIGDMGELVNNKTAGVDSVISTSQLFAIRQLFLEIPGLAKLVFNSKLLDLVKTFDGGFFLSKAIYFDKPKDSNWFVAFHQDLTINVCERFELEGFKNWTNKQAQIGVQPPIEYLENTLTVRIHLDDTDASNGALRVIPKSHTNGVVKPEDSLGNQEVICEVPEGGIMLMRPLLIHASSRSTGNQNRRVIHLEFCNKELPEPLAWKEKQIVEDYSIAQTSDVHIPSIR